MFIKPYILPKAACSTMSLYFPGSSSFRFLNSDNFCFLQICWLCCIFQRQTFVNFGIVVPAVCYNVFMEIKSILGAKCVFIDIIVSITYSFVILLITLFTGINGLIEFSCCKTKKQKCCLSTEYAMSLGCVIFALLILNAKIQLLFLLHS